MFTFPYFPVRLQQKMEEILNFIRRSKPLGVKIDICHIAGLFFRAFLPRGAHALSTLETKMTALWKARSVESISQKSR